MSKQIELFALDSFIDRDFYYGCHDHHTTAISTKHKKRPIKKDRPGKGKRSHTPTIHTI